MKSTLVLTILSLLLVACSPIDLNDSAAHQRRIKELEAEVAGLQAQLQAELAEKICIKNMRLIEGAKDLAALENRLATGDDPGRFVAALMRGGIPTCNVGGHYNYYNINNVGTAVTCSSGIGTHVLR